VFKKILTTALGVKEDLKYRGKEERKIIFKAVYSDNRLNKMFISGIEGTKLVPNNELETPSQHSVFVNITFYP